MFDCTEISETIYEGDVESPYKNTNRENANDPGHTRQKRGEPTLSQTYPEIDESTGKLRKNI